MISNYEAEKLNEALKSISASTQNDRVGMVGQVLGTDDDGTTWVHILGGTEMTPVETTTVEVAEGDIVDVTIGGGKARILSNVTQPSASVLTVNNVRNVATTAAANSDAAKQLSEASMVIAGEAAAVANATKQHFWTDESGTHVTEVTQEEFLEEPQGANQLSNANGMLLRDGETNLAQFTPSGVAFYDGQGNTAANISGRFGATLAQVGKSSDMHATVDANGLRVYDSQGNLVSYFTASNARIGNNAGDYAVVNSNGIYFYKGNVLIGYCLGDSARLGTVAEGVKNVITNANGIYLRENTTNLASFTPDAITVGKTGTGQKNLYATSDGLYLRNGTTNLASFTPSTLELGSTDAQITLAGRGNVRQGLSETFAQGETSDVLRVAGAPSDAVAKGAVHISGYIGDTGGIRLYSSTTTGSTGRSIIDLYAPETGAASTLNTRITLDNKGGKIKVQAEEFEFVPTAEPLKYALGIGGRSGLTPQDFTVTVMNGVDQVFGMAATCVNTANTAQDGNRFILIPRNNGLGLYNATDSAWMWNISNLDTATNTTPTNVITGNSTNAEIQGARRALWGKMCQVYVNWKSKNAITVAASGDIATNVTIGTLTSVCRPAIYAMGISNGDAGGNGAMYDIATDGTVKLTACNARNGSYTIPAGTTFYMYALFIVP